MKIGTPIKASLRVVPPASLSVLKSVPGIDYENETVTFMAAVLKIDYENETVTFNFERRMTVSPSSSVWRERTIPR